MASGEGCVIAAFSYAHFTTDDAGSQGTGVQHRPEIGTRLLEAIGSSTLWLVVRPPILISSPFRRGYCVTVTVIGVELCSDPELAVIVTLYVPACVPPDDEEAEPPPQPASMSSKTAAAAINTIRAMPA